MTKHTPGPWYPNHDAYGYWCVAEAKNHAVVADMKSIPAAEANARLIAAAVELLAVLEEVRYYFEESQQTGVIPNLVAAAIAKATS